MDDIYFWRVFLLLSVGTLLIRFSIIAISAKVKISDRVKEIFSFIPAAILPALVAPMIFFHSGQVSWLLGKERLLVLVLAVAFCYYTRSMILTVGFGLATLFLVSQI